MNLFEYLTKILSLVYYDFFKLFKIIKIFVQPLYVLSILDKVLSKYYILMNNDVIQYYAIKLFDIQYYCQLFNKLKKNV